MKKSLIVLLILSLTLSMGAFAFAADNYGYSTELRESPGFSSCFAVIDALTGEVFYVSEDQWLSFMSIVNMNDDENTSKREQITEAQINILKNNLLDEWRVDDTVTITRNFERGYYFENGASIEIQNIMPFQTPYSLLLGNFTMTRYQTRTFSNSRRPTNNFYPVNGTITVSGWFAGGSITHPPEMEFRLILGGETNTHTALVTAWDVRRAFTNLHPSHGFRVGIVNRTQFGATTVHVDSFTVTSLR